MFRNSNYNPSTQYEYQYSWDTMIPQEYHERVSVVQTTPGVLPDVSRYVDTHMLFNKKAAYNEEEREPIHHQYEKIQGHAATPHKRVHFVEKEKIITEGDRYKKREEISVDAEADGFINRKHKNFELAKWETFKQGY